MIEVFDKIEQNSPAWFEIRRGLPTASQFKAILAKGEGKTRAAYMRKLAAEIITGQPSEEFKRPEFDRGHAMEAEARNFYSFLADADPQLVGFVRNGQKGASPDAFIGDNGLLEIKTQRGDLLVDTILKGDFPSEHIAQIQGQLWVTDREWCDLVVYWPNMPAFIRRAYRDSPYIKKLSDAVDQFNDELAYLVEKIKTYSPSLQSLEKVI